ncbi:leucine-rich repeat-containing protein 57-like [Diaphorina citri]|uniref:Leucine-rich repeat-containing protein 57-like n=1 Tax=Diaphorina citri TaxID=121845 RepID=A0A1S3DHZ8_DIACI|nr:leucine-rich repeat-containing protein 57-like [Diaphorina citri]
MGNSATKRHFETAKKTGVINLSHQGFKEFPDEMNELKAVLRTLDISQNKISKFPLDLASYQLLKSLTFDQNKIESLPKDIGTLEKLENVSGNCNLIKELPLSFSKLHNLKHLSLSQNQLNKFPTVLFNLQHLDVLDLSFNRIESIPDGIGKMKVIEMNLNKNQICHISPDISECVRLKILRLEENCLAINAIPTCILTSSNVCTLNVEGNLFEMKAFQQLDGYNNYMDRYTSVKKKMF